MATMIVEAHSEHSHHQNEKIELDDRDSRLNEVRLLMDKASHGNKEDYYSQAAKLLDKLKYSSVQSRLYKAEIQQYFHQFDEAVSTLSGNRHDPATSLMRAGIYFTQGKMTLAQQECKNIFGKVDNLLAITCMAQANSLLGELDKGYQVLTAAIKHVNTDDKQSLAWAYVTLAEMSERRFDRETAKLYYLKALKLNKNDHPSRIAYADLLLEEKKYRQVLSLTKDYLQNDLVMLRYVRALNIQGDPTTSDHFCELKRRVLNYTAKNKHLHYDLLAEYYLYFSDNFEYSLQWAKQHWQQQKTPRDARLLARVAIKAVDSDSLDKISQWRTTYHVEDKGYDRLLTNEWLVSLN